MKLATFTHAGRTRIGAVVGDELADLSAADPQLPGSMLALLQGGDAALEAARAALGRARQRLPLLQVRLEAPIARPPKFLGVALNYADHAAESGRKPPEHPTLFNKQSTCVVGPYDPIHLPRVSSALDYEGELGVVIGKHCRHVSRAEAPRAIAGYLVVNDVSVRDWQFRAPTMTMGKSFDTHGPLGPWLVSTDELGDPHGLDLRTWVNGELRQSSNTKQLIFDCFALVEHLSTAFTLEPGDVITTGTPAGVGFASKPPRMLRAGDTVRIEIEGIGRIENPVIDEPLSTARLG
jgi:2-keto-4-pentenoate hydratase/2-oxohepta-3-ene-1,7-dioic acid hydratase in catechol pathway